MGYPDLSALPAFMGYPDPSPFPDPSSAVFMGYPDPFALPFFRGVQTNLAAQMFGGGMQTLPCSACMGYPNPSLRVFTVSNFLVALQNLLLHCLWGIQTLLALSVYGVSRSFSFFSLCDVSMTFHDRLRGFAVEALNAAFEAPPCLQAESRLRNSDDLSNHQQ